jgi:hypothetical protein
MPGGGAVGPRGAVSAGSYAMMQPGFGQIAALQNEGPYGAQGWFEARRLKEPGDDPSLENYILGRPIAHVQRTMTPSVAEHSMRRTMKHHEAKENPLAVELAAKTPPGVAKTHAAAHVEAMSGEGLRRQLYAFVPVAKVLADASPIGAAEIAEAAAAVPSHVSAIRAIAGHMKKQGRLHKDAAVLADESVSNHGVSEILRESSQKGQGFWDTLKNIGKTVLNVAGNILPGPFGMAAKIGAQAIPE